MNLNWCMLWLMPGGRAPSSPEEMVLVAALAVVGLILAACVAGPLLRTMRALEQRKKPRGERGRPLLQRMISPTGFPVPTTMGQSLRGQDLRGEDLKDAFLADVDLSDTDLRGVDLSGADLGGVYVVGARYDAHTRWPDGFDPVKAGAVRVE
jgi:hypothetical protein